MERLTKREILKTSNNEEFVGCNIEISQMNSCPDCNDSCMYGRCKWQEKANQKLKEYEDLEEQGLLLKLPCKVGTMVYEVYDFGLAWEDWQIDQHPISLEDIPKFGKTVFLTNAEAEKALEEMEEEMEE